MGKGAAATAKDVRRRCDQCFVYPRCRKAQPALPALSYTLLLDAELYAASLARQTLHCTHSHSAPHTKQPYSTRYPVLRMMCTPESVSTMPEISPTASACVASSNAFIIWPGPNSPRSPPLRAELQSEAVCAMREKSCGECMRPLQGAGGERSEAARESWSLLAVALPQQEPVAARHRFRLGTEFS